MMAEAAVDAIPTLHFPREAFEQRIARARALLQERGLSALLLFGQESHYYLTGFDTSGFVYFQCCVLTADDQPLTLLTRLPDRQQAFESSILEDVRIWYDAEGADPALELKDILDEKGLAGETIGIELDTYGLTAWNYDRLQKALGGWCQLTDASDVIRSLRLIKSDQELVHIRRAAVLADDALAAMLRACTPGTLESSITAVGLKVMLDGGGDVPPGPPLVNSGRRALFGRGISGPRPLSPVDQVTIEFASTFRRYNVCIMRTAIVGEPSEEQRDMFALTHRALDAMTEAAAPGRPLGDIDGAYREVFDAAGHQTHRWGACGYSLGATFRPSWMDVPPMLYSGNPTLAQPGMVLFLHSVFPNVDSGLAMSLGHTILVMENGREVLSNAALDFPVCG
jgi:Xaa-Pro dipeptidase